MLAIHNIANTIRLLPENNILYIPVQQKVGKKMVTRQKELITHPLPTLQKALENDPKVTTSVMMQYFAASHNNPLHAYHGLLDWLKVYEMSPNKSSDRLGNHIELVATR